jgi:hypothetical protein
VVSRCLAAFALVASAPAAARAGDGESALGIAAAYGQVAIPEHEPIGGALAIDYRRGISDALWLRGALVGAALRTGGETSYLGQASLGIGYALDVLRYVPYVDLGIGAAWLGGGALEAEVHPQLQIGVGLDVRVGREMSWGPFASMAGYLDEASAIAVGLRCAYRWGYF